MRRIRRATYDDLVQITQIYNEAVIRTTATFDTEPTTVEEQGPWFEKHNERLPLLVMEEDGKILGWASLSEWSGRCAYAETAENSVYVTNSHQRQGLGKELLIALLEHAKSVKLHTILARVADGSPASLRLHESLGFARVGTMKEVGLKFGKRVDVHLLQKMLKA